MCWSGREQERSELITPLVSVVIPVRDEQRYLRGCLEAVLAQHYPAERFEVLVVDGGSTDDSRRIVRELGLSHPHLRLLDNPAGTIPRALNLGIEAARGDVVVRVDARAVIAPDYLASCRRALEGGAAVNVGGPMRCRGLGFWGQAIARAMNSPFGIPSTFRHATNAREVDTVYLGAWRRETLLAVGLFDESLLRNEDFELNYRLRRTGGRVLCLPKIQVEYYVRESLGELARQHWDYARAKAIVLRQSPAALRPRQIVPPLFVLAFAAGGALALLGELLPLLILVGLYAGAAGFSAWRAARGRGIRLAAAVALAFACLHLSWGLGLLVEFAAQACAALLRRKAVPARA